MTVDRNTSASPSTGTKRPADGMVWIPGSEFLMGSDGHYEEEAPAHKVRVDGFWIDRYTITNREFRRFVDATGHVTLAERPVDPDEYPGADPSKLAPASVVFRKAPKGVDLRRVTWWDYVPGADWRHPRGPASSLQGLWDHPVVQVSFDDAMAYAAWAGKTLPTEAEWECAARGGLEGAEYVWGGELYPGGKPMANTWQGEFPWQNLAEDGYEWTAPVGTFPQNGFGLYDMAGNVWQWTTDWYQSHGKITKACCTMENPRGAAREDSIDPRVANLKVARKVIKGGSFLCAPNYCRRYRPAARMAQEVNSATCHIGIRCIVRPGEDR
jgi:formylglycine-generating enzyme required for sulfatase activity